ncbi:flagellar hook assembly protein FlgD [Ramlibacter alkalitolerans]|uniref:Basal-body rod modification protein FlgD n=1 Tax=Ramlibacter alkalitolerans TaxID=2039631 RepID=A0ABS1JKU8_9BURK|nr:flagellar hook assembly protein FlgD [Ramlibacter alkalitolerans]MBL0424859.1 flagellar hook assembly protein FlgD [Ramlibacter alkalitolerans]
MTPITATGSMTTSTAKAGGLTSAADQEDRFMKLLVAQMKNQDPLNPMDNAQMTSQIAQINTVGGLEKLNTTVESLLAAFNGAQVQSALQLPGRSVLVEGSALSLAAGQATGGVQLAAAADTVSVDILDAAGQVVQQIALGASGAGARSFRWDGRTADGGTAPEGSYRIRVSASAGGQPVQATALTTQQVRAVSNASDGLRLDLGAGGSQPWSAIRSFL